MPHKRAIMIGGFVAGFGLAMMLFALMSVLSIEARLTHYMYQQVRSLNDVTDKWAHTLDRLAGLRESEACSPDFLQKLRAIAFLPDGIHELLYAKGNMVICSVTMDRLAQPIDIGAPDFTLRRKRSIEIWANRDLSVFGRPEFRGTFIRVGNFLMIVVEPEPLPTPADWITTRIIFNADQRNPAENATAHPADAIFTQSRCEMHDIFCVEAHASFGGFLAEQRVSIAIGFLIAALLGLFAGRGLGRKLDELWAFPTRVEKLMDDSRIDCDYQPILSLSEDRISGIEVLARWRDITGDTVLPDDFLPIIEARRLSRPFTEILVRHVYRDLLALPDQGALLRVHFNIYPVDFDAEWLLAVFSPLLALSDRYVIVVELLETQHVPVDEVRQTTQSLNAAGILTYIDDFGAGYSNIEYLANIAVSAVKLDRSFGRAPEGSIMAELLLNAARMIRAAGFSLLVEGVETASKLDALRNSGLVDQAQGYFISRPLAFPDLVAFLDNHRKRPSPEKTRLTVS